MKKLLILFAVLSATALFSGEPVPIAVEDFGRYVPGTYNMKDGTTWNIVEENGIKMLRTKPDTNVLCGWSYRDIRKKQLRLRVHFRMQYGIVLFQTKQKGGALLSLSESEIALQDPEGKKGTERIDGKAILSGAWVTIEFVLNDAEVEVAHLTEDGARKVLFSGQSEEFKKGLNDPKLTFSKPSDIDLIESFTLDEDLQALKNAHK